MEEHSSRDAGALGRASPGGKLRVPAVTSAQRSSALPGAQAKPVGKGLPTCG